MRRCGLVFISVGTSHIFLEVSYLHVGNLLSHLRLGGGEIRYRIPMYEGKRARKGMKERDGGNMGFMS